MTSRLPTFFIPHGAGPCFFMDWPGDPHMWDKMAAFLGKLGQCAGTPPKAVLVISGHWIEEEFSVTAAAAPQLLFDYYGFPPHTYELQYPAPGDPELAQRVRQLLGEAGFKTSADGQRGFDHGVFIPFKLIYPDANIPIVQLSLKAGLDAATHLRAGAALEALRSEGVLIVGSGLSFHNMRGFNPAFTDISVRFDQWLTGAVTQAEVRSRLLEQWEQAPEARLTHPNPDHLLPLMMAAGAGGSDPGCKIFEDQVMHVQVSAFAFGLEPAAQADLDCAGQCAAHP